MPSALPLFALLYVAGVVLGDALRCDESVARTLSLLTLPLLLGAAWRRALLGPVLLGAALCLGLWAQARRPPSLSIVPLPREDVWRCEGQVTSAVTSTPSGVMFRVAVNHVGSLSGDVSFSVQPSAVVLLSVSGRLEGPLLPGDRLRFAASLRDPEGHRNPGSSDRGRQLAGLGVSAVASLPPTSLLRLETPFAWPGTASLETRWQWLELFVLRTASMARGRLLLALKARLLAPPMFPAVATSADRFGLLAALLLGDRGPLYAADAERAAAGRTAIEWSFRAAGIYHILSVSGLHLAVAGWALYHGLLWLLLFVPGLPQRFVVRRLAALCALPAVLFYALLTGAELPTVRAAVAAVSWLVAVACGRRARLLEAVAVAILCIARPSTACAPSLLIFEPSLLLSLAATLSIAYLRPLGSLIGWVRPLFRGPLRLLDASLAATLSTLPLCAYYFAEAQPAGVFGNLLAVPIGEFIVLPGGLLGVGLSVSAARLGGPLLEFSGLCGAIMVRLAEQLARLGLSWSVPSPSPLHVALWSIGLVLFSARRARAGAVLCAAGLGLYLIGAWLPPRELRVTFLDVGQGDAAVIELPQGGVVVIDAGPTATNGRDFGELVVAPFLRRRGHRRIELLIASHRHPDHIGGLSTLLEKFPVKTLWIPPGERAAIGATPRSKAQVREAAALTEAWQRLSQTAIRRGVHVEAPRDRTFAGVAIEVLSPCQEAGADASRASCSVAAQPGFGENDNSLVVRLRYAGRSILFPGDLELDGELLLLDRHDDGVAVAADVLKAPHHCSRTSSSESLLDAVAPSWIICSAGRKNRFGFPHAEVLARYLARGSVVFNTAEHGAVTVSIRPDGALAISSIASQTIRQNFPLALPEVKR
jgi:competence protein ComEC